MVVDSDEEKAEMKWHGPSDGTDDESEMEWHGPSDGTDDEVEMEWYGPSDGPDSEMVRDENPVLPFWWQSKSNEYWDVRTCSPATS